MRAVAERTPPPGIHAVLYAFFDADERLDRAAMRRQVDALVGSGIAGVTVLGLATEVTRLSVDERLVLIDWVAEDVAGRLPFSVTISGSSVAEQHRLLHAAEAAGADWTILQPPIVGTYAADEYLRFFRRVAEAATVPTAIQNAPAYLGRGLAPDDIQGLFEACPAMRAVKAEGSAIEVERLIERLGRGVPVFNGRGGLELTDTLRAGCAGLILAPDLVDRAAAVHRNFAGGDDAEAERGYTAMLPAATFIMQSLETLVTYGKRIFAARADIGPVHDRRPALAPTPFGLATVERLVRALGPFGQAHEAPPIEARS